MKWSCPWLGRCLFPDDYCDLCPDSLINHPNPLTKKPPAYVTIMPSVSGRGGEQGTDRQNNSAVSVEINDCGDEKAGRLANGVGSWPAGQDRGSAVRDEDRTSPLDTPSSLEHPATAQLQLVRAGGVREGRPQLKCHELSSNQRRGKKSEKYHHQKGRKAGETETNAHTSGGS